MRAVALDHRLGRGVGLLQVDAPIFEFLDRDGLAGDRAAHKGAGLDHAEVAVEEFDHGFAVHRRGTVIAIEQERPPFPDCGNIMLHGLARKPAAWLVT